MRAALFGGTFNPIHHGHLITAAVAGEALAIDTVILMPAYRSPFKEQHDDTMQLHRLQMCRLATDGDKRFLVSDWEIRKGGTSYTIDAIHSLIASGYELTLIIGNDQIPRFHEWKDWDEIFKLTEVAVLRRNSEAESANPVIPGDRFRFINTPNIDISSTQIRDRVKQNLPINYLVPSSVADYIRYHKLYQSGNENG